MALAPKGNQFKTGQAWYLQGTRGVTCMLKTLKIRPITVPIS